MAVCGVLQREATSLLRQAAERCSAEADMLEANPEARADAVGDTVPAANAVVRPRPKPRRDSCIRSVFRAA